MPCVGYGRGQKHFDCRTSITTLGEVDGEEATEEGETMDTRQHEEQPPKAPRKFTLSIAVMRVKAEQMGTRKGKGKKKRYGKWIGIHYRMGKTKRGEARIGRCPAQDTFSK